MRDSNRAGTLDIYSRLIVRIIAGRFDWSDLYQSFSFTCLAFRDCLAARLGLAARFISKAVDAKGDRCLCVRSEPDCGMPRLPATYLKPLWIDTARLLIEGPP